MQFPKFKTIRFVLGSEIAEYFKTQLLNYGVAILSQQNKGQSMKFR